MTATATLGFVQDSFDGTQSLAMKSIFKTDEQVHTQHGIENPRNDFRI
jgi:hypothetical protein